MMYLNTLILLLILLVDPAVCQDNKQIDGPDLVRLVNWRRRQLAKMFWIPNMHELVWDENLAEKAKSSINFRSTPNGDDWRSTGYGVIAGYHEASKILRQGIKTYSKNFRDIMKYVKYRQPYTVEDLELFVPGQKKIGCSMKAFDKDVFLLCVLGPENTFSSMGVGRGRVGSKCDKGEKNIDGLCRSK
ncbi:hypothetical protein CAEBREN_06858 [Caenorhabditis brenneri]|uniref:SCP domain-containing protein n=1 Tax=Caenorhabditis brenneri TaxID=135651 RepID=G0MCR3_CAEBE|nr:hypothetical protein CAEBREN_06858 [Caenorhabditis brenneri]